MSIPDVGCFTFNDQDLFLRSGKQILIVLNVSPPGEEEYADVACEIRGRWLFLGLEMISLLRLSCLLSRNDTHHKPYWREP